MLTVSIFCLQISPRRLIQRDRFRSNVSDSVASAIVGAALAGTKPRQNSMAFDKEDANIGLIRSHQLDVDSGIELL